MFKARRGLGARHAGPASHSPHQRPALGHPARPRPAGPQIRKQAPQGAPTGQPQPSAATPPGMATHQGHRPIRKQPPHGMPPAPAPRANPGAPPPGMAGSQRPQGQGQSGPEAGVQNMLGQQASMQRINALQKQMGVPATPQGQV